MGQVEVELQLQGLQGPGRIELELGPVEVLEVGHVVGHVEVEHAPVVDVARVWVEAEVEVEEDAKAQAGVELELGQVDVEEADV